MAEPVGEEQEFKVISEGWNEYKLKDGATLKVKLVMIKVVKTGEYNPDGTPIYWARSQNVMYADVPRELRRKS